MDLVDDSIRTVEPHLIAPFFFLARGCLAARDGVVVDQVPIADVSLERGVCGSAAWKDRHTYNCYSMIT